MDTKDYYTCGYITISKILRDVSLHTGISEKLIKGKTRKRNVVLARHLVCYLSKVHTKSTLKEIGGFLGGRDHATVIHGARNTNNIIETYYHKELYVFPEEVIIAKLGRKLEDLYNNIKKENETTKQRAEKLTFNNTSGRIKEGKRTSGINWLKREC